MDGHILACLPQRLKDVFRKCSPVDLQGLEEIRIRVQRPVEVLIGSRSCFITPDGECTPDWRKGIVTTIEDGQKMLNQISRHSLYALEEELRRGYITIRGGHRVGITGRAVVEGGKVKLLKDIQSFNLRMARELKGVAAPVLPRLLENGRFGNTLIISPPGCGKTTLLRDIARCLSYGMRDFSLKGLKIGIVDERSEIASCMDGIPQNDLGPRADVLDACPKAEGMMMLIRSMSPDVIVCDEIGSLDDAQAVLEAMHAGVAILVSAHGHSLADVRERPSLRMLFEETVFERIMILSKRKGVGTVEGVFDGAGRRLADPAGKGIRHA